MLINENKFYIYKWIRLDTNMPFYIGKGTGGRFNKIHQRNQYFKRIHSSVQTKVEIIIDNLSEKESFIKEAEFIKFYKNLGYCEANFTNGGEGPSGRIVSQKSREKISSGNKGKIVSQETKDKQSAIRKGKTPYNKGNIVTQEQRLNNAISHGSKLFLVFNKNNELVGEWISKSECSRFLNICIAGISLCLNNKRKTHNSYRFEYKIG